MLNFTDTDMKPTASEPYWPPRRTMPSCTGACDQGRKPCQAPQACYHDEDGDWEPLTWRECWDMYAAPVAVVLAALGAAVYAVWG